MIIKRTKIYIVIFLTMIVLVLLYGIYMKNSISGTLDPDKFINTEKNLVINHINQENIGFLKNVKGLNDIEKRSDAVVKAKVCEKRYMTFYSVHTKIYIEKIYKDKTSMLSEKGEVNLIEPIEINYNCGEYITGGYQLTQKENEYILFLNRLRHVKGYRYNKNELISFMPSSEYFSKYSLSDMQKAKKLQMRNALYKNYIDYPIISQNDKIVSLYNHIYDEILQKQGAQNLL